MLAPRETEIIVIGAGAAGLAAAGGIARSGRRVMVLEARPRTGGRVFTLHPRGVSEPVELGAEFIHGRHPGIFRLLRELGLEAEEVSASRWEGGAEGLRPDRGSWEKMERVLDALKPRAHDVSFKEALELMRAPAESKDAAERFVASYHAAELSRISSNDLAFQQRMAATSAAWKNYRVKGGYDELIRALARKLPESAIRLGEPVKALRWSASGAEVLTSKGRYRAGNVILTVPLSLLKTSGPGAIDFVPALPRQVREALRRLEMGFAARMSFLFKKDCFWEPRAGRGKGGFFHSDGAEVPVWWSYGEGIPILTGWLGGPRSKGITESRMRQKALASLGRIFQERVDSRPMRPRDAYFHDWAADPFSCGAYSYCGVGGMPARRLLGEPIGGALFLAGEAFDQSGEAGTVAGALLSGIRAAARITGIVG